MKIKPLHYALVALSLGVLSAVSCEKKAETPDTLAVTPSDDIAFAAKDAEPDTLVVTTSVATWTFTTPEWVEGSSEGDKLILKAKDNEGGSRVGRVTVSAGKARNVNINVTQAAAENMGDDPVPVEKVAAKLVCESEQTVFHLKDQPVSVSLKVTLEKASGQDVTVTLSLDPDYAREYSYTTGDSYAPVPTEAVSFSATKLVIAAGQTESETVSMTLTDDPLGFGEGYLVPVLAAVAEGDAAFASDSRRINLVANRVRQSSRVTRQVVYLEVNDTNPLNLLEYNLQDGTPFFDAVVLFAANINYKSSDDVVYLHNNANVSALLEQTDVYLQPLRKRGIKVYLGLLGNHDQSGLAQLSEYGAKEFASEVAKACRTYKLDGVNLDDEYSTTPDISNRWFTTPSAAAGARLCYELKQALKRECYWETEVSVFEWGNLRNLPEVTIDGVTHKQSEFIDWKCSNYRTNSTPYGDLTYANCAGYSVELYLKTDITEARLNTVKSGGYGWLMWFAFDPAASGSRNNLSYSMPLFQSAASILYGQELVQPQNIYKKIAEGQYDPMPYPINS